MPSTDAINRFRRMNRRSLLRAGGVALSLPWLESLSDTSAKAVAQAKSPKNFLAIYHPNGMHKFASRPGKPPGRPDGDWPTAAGALGPLPDKIFSPLQDHAQNLVFFSGLDIAAGMAYPEHKFDSGDHAKGSATFLTCAKVLVSTSELRGGVSMDQKLASRIGGSSLLKSLTVRPAPRGVAGCNAGYACAYHHYISWQSETTPTQQEVSPRAIFDLLFRDAGTQVPMTTPQGEPTRTQTPRERWVLDAVNDRVKSLSKVLNSADRKKLEEYTTNVQEVQRRLSTPVSAVPTLAACSDTVTRPLGAGDGKQPTGLQYQANVRLVYDLLALAFSCGRSKVATYMLDDEGSGRNYDFLTYPDGSRVTDSHHTLSHYSSPRMQEGVRLLNRYHVTEFSRFIDKLKNTKGAMGNSLLDESVVLFGAAMSDGQMHIHQDIPMILASGKEAPVKTGIHFMAPPKTPAANLYLAVMQMFGGTETSFGDSTGSLNLG